MKTITATEAKNRFGAVIDDAQREPIVIQRQERDVAVVISMKEYERIRRSNIDAFLEARNALAAEAKRNGLTEEKLREILDAED